MLNILKITDSIQSYIHSNDTYLKLRKQYVANTKRKPENAVVNWVKFNHHIGIIVIKNYPINTKQHKQAINIYLKLTYYHTNNTYVLSDRKQVYQLLPPKADIKAAIPGNIIYSKHSHKLLAKCHTLEQLEKNVISLIKLSRKAMEATYNA